MCEHEYVDYIAQGDEGLWGKDYFCSITRRYCMGEKLCNECGGPEARKEEAKSGWF